MTPGRELDILVAEKVMGWKRVNYEQLFPSQAGRKELSMYWYDSNDKETRLAEDSDDYYQPEEAWSPSIDISAAWEVVKKMQEDGFDLDLHYKPEYTIVCFEKIVDGLTVAESGEVWSNTPLHAICLAALKAVGVESKKNE